MSATNVITTTVFEGVFDLIIVVLCALITAYVIPWIKTKITSKQTDYIANLVYSAVNAAEQIYGKHSGKEKKEYAVNFILEQCSRLGIETTEEFVSNEIEKVVAQFNDVWFKDKEVIWIDKTPVQVNCNNEANKVNEADEVTELTGDTDGDSE